MIAAIDNIKPRGHNARNLIFLVFSFVMFASVFVQHASACCVTEARIWAGETRKKANDKDYDPPETTIVYICKGDPAYFYAECDVDADSESPCRRLIWTFDFDDGSSITKYTYADSGVPDTEDHPDEPGPCGGGIYNKIAEHPYTSAAAREPSVTVEREGAGCDAWNATCKVTIINVDIYNEHAGPKLDDDDEVNPGSFVLINKDDDDGVNGIDNSNNVIDGASDKLDMAKIKLNVPSSVTGVTIELSAVNADKVRVFNESDTKVTLPETIAASRFASGAIYYHVEGISEGVVTFALKIKDGAEVKCEDNVKLTVKDYVEWKAWPGGQSTALNRTETFTSSDLGLSGAVDWTLLHGGTTGATIVSTVPSGGSGSSAESKTSITVRYDSQSADASFTKGVEVKAYDTGADSKLAAVRRTVFKVTWSPLNFETDLDGDNDLEFPLWSGTDVNEAGFNWKDDNDAERVSAKMEAILNFEPTGIDWDARGVTFVHGSGGSKFSFRLERVRRGTILPQYTTEANREIGLNSSGWVLDGYPNIEDAQYPKVAKPNKAFRIDCPYMDVDELKQGSLRTDFIELAEWHNDSGWSQISSATNADWFANETCVLPDGSKGGENNHGTGTASNVPNTTPVADAGQDASCESEESDVTLHGDYSDADNDTVTYKWRQISGPTVTLSDDTAKEPSFTAPVGPATLVFGLKVSDITKDLYYHNPGNYESTEDTVTITVNAP